MTTAIKVPLITVKDTGVQGPPGWPDHANGMIMASLAEMIQATLTKDSQTPAIAFSCSFSDEKGTALSKLISVCSTANFPAQIAAWCFQLQGKMGFLQQGESSLLVGRFSHVFHLQSTVSIACMELEIHLCPQW